MSQDIFDEAGAENNNETGSIALGGFDLAALGATRANESDTSERVENVIELYKKLQKKNPAALPYQLITMRPEWLDERELLVMFLQYNGKTAITPILFGSDTIDEEMTNSRDRMVRAANFNITKYTPRKDKESALSGGAEQSGNRFLTLCVEEMLEQGLITKQSSWGDKNLDLAGCIVVNEEQDVAPAKIISAATSEMRSSLVGLFGTNDVSEKEKDINYKNHTNVTTVVDLTTTPNSRDMLGNPQFSPLLIRLSHHRRNKLSSGSGTSLVPKLEIPGYLDFRLLRTDEIAEYTAKNMPAPLLVPQFVMVGLHNKMAEGVITPANIQDAIAGIQKFEGDDLFKLFDQSAQYATTVDPSCSTYDWNQLGALLKLVAMERNPNLGITDFSPCDPVAILTGQDMPTPMQRQQAYRGAFAPLEVLIDVPHSGEMAKVRQQLLSELNYHHYKLTGKQNNIAQALGYGILSPHGTWLRVGETQQRRDIREVMNVLGLMGKFHHGSTYTDNFVRGVNHAAGQKVLEDASLEKEFKEAYVFVTEQVIDDGSYQLITEQQRIRVDRKYMDKLAADLASNGVTYEMRHSGAELINRLVSSQSTTSSVNFQNAY